MLKTHETEAQRFANAINANEEIGFTAVVRIFDDNARVDLRSVKYGHKVRTVIFYGGK